MLHIVVYDHNKFMREDAEIPVATIAHSSRQYSDIDWPHNLCPTEADAKKGINSPGVLHMSLDFTPAPPRASSPPPPVAAATGAEDSLGTKMKNTLFGAFGGDGGRGGSSSGGSGGASAPPSPQPSIEAAVAAAEVAAAAEAEMPLSPGWRSLGASSGNLLRVSQAAAASEASAAAAATARASAAASTSSAHGAHPFQRGPRGLLERGASLRGDTLQRHRRQSALQRGRAVSLRRPSLAGSTSPGRRGPRGALAPSCGCSCRRRTTSPSSPARWCATSRDTVGTAPTRRPPLLVRRLAALPQTSAARCVTGSSGCITSCTARVERPLTTSTWSRGPPSPPSAARPRAGRPGRTARRASAGSRARRRCAGRACRA